MSSPRERRRGRSETEAILAAVRDHPEGVDGRIEALSWSDDPAQNSISVYTYAVNVGVFPTRMQLAFEILRDNPELMRRALSGEISLHHAFNVHRDPSFRTQRQLRADRLERIRTLAESGMHTSQVAAEVGLSPETLRALMRSSGIPITENRSVPSATSRGRDPIGEIVDGLAGFAAALQALPRTIETDQATARDLVQTLGSALRAFGSLHRRLKEISHVQDQDPDPKP